MQRIMLPPPHSRVNLGVLQADSGVQRRTGGLEEGRATSSTPCPSYSRAPTPAAELDATGVGFEIPSGALRLGRESHPCEQRERL